MAPPKKAVLRALSDAHLRAIGMVAAQWSSLEISLLWVVARVFGVTLSQAVILAGAQNATAWCEMLRKETNPPTKSGQQRPKTELDTICIEITGLLKSRNDVVHTAWDEWTPGIVQRVIMDKLESRPTARHKASGTGIPKRGNNIFIETEFTAAEMNAIAKRIGAAERAILLWWNERNKRQQIAKMLRTA